MSDDRDIHQALEKREDRRFQLLTVILAGLIGLVGAFGGTYGALKVTDKQIAAQREDSRDQFLRDERRSAYGAMIALDGQLNAAEAKLNYPKSQSPHTAAKEIQANTARVNDMVDRLQAAGSTVVLIGSAALANAADSLVAAHRAYTADLSALAGLEVVAASRRDLKNLKDLLKDLRLQVKKSGEDLISAQSQFLARSRLELANGIDLDPLNLDAPKKDSSPSSSD